MKKWLIGIGGFLLVGLGAALVVPGFMDWNPYREYVAAEVEELTGRRLDIGGDLRLRLLPSPALSVKDVRLTASDDERTEDLLRLDALDVAISLRALLSGEIRVERVSLRRPVVMIRRDADGRLNWIPTETVERKADLNSGAAPPPPSSSGGNGDMPIDVQFDQVEIVDGTVFYRDAVADVDERFDDVNVTVAAERLEGPFIAYGSLVAQEFPLTFAVELGKRGRDGQRPIDAEVTLAPNEASVRLKGAINLGDTKEFAGDVSLEGRDLAAFWKKIESRPLPGFLAQQFTVSGKLSAGPKRAEVDDLSIVLGEIRGRGHVSVAMPDAAGESGLNVEIALHVDRMNADAWMAMVESGTGEEKKATEPAPTMETANAVRPEENPLSGFRAIIDFSVDGLVVHGGLVRDARAYAEVIDGEIALHQMSARLPGGSEAAAFGFVGMANGQPHFDGELQIDAPDLRGLLTWLGIDPAGVPSSRLRTLALHSKITSGLGDAELHEINLVVDGSTLTGAARADWAERRRLRMDLNLDHLNLDAYLPKGMILKEGSVSPVGSALDTPDARDEAFSLDEIDADVIFRIGELTVQDILASDVLIDGTLSAGDARLREVSVGDVVGASAAVAGVVDSISQQPTMRDLRFGMRAGDVGALVRAFGQRAPAVLASIGGVAASGTLNGDVFSPQAELTVIASGGEATFAGILGLAGPPTAEGQVRLRHDRPGQLITAVGSGYRPQGPFDPVDLTADVRASADEVTVAGLTGHVNGASVAGDLRVALGAAKPRATVDLELGRFALDPFLPADESAQAPTDRWQAVFSVMPGATRRPVENAILPASVTANTRWSRQPFDLSVLTAIDADIGVKAEALSVEHYALEEADVRATLADGVLSVRSLTGLLLGGPMQASATLDARGTPIVDVSLRAEDMRMSQIAQSSAATGRIRANLEVDGGGASMAEVVSSLNGSASAALTDANPAEGFFGVLHGPLLQLPGVAAGLARTLSGAAEASASWVIEDGAAHSSDIRFVSPVGSGDAEGITDLTAWWTDNAGTFTLSQEAANALKSGMFGLTLPDRLPFRVQGPPDRPDVTWDLKRLSLRPGSSGDGESTKRAPKLPEVLRDAPALPSLKGVLEDLSR